MEKFSELDRLLEYMENNIDVDHIKKSEQLQYDAMKYNKVPHLPLTMRITPEGYKQIPLEEAFDNPELMLYNELLWSTMHSSYNSVRVKDDCPLMVRSNHGIGIIASMFGCESHIVNNSMPWVDHLDWDTAQKAFENGVPNFKNGLGGKVINTYEHYAQRLAKYPKCSAMVHLSQPDLQGPYDILHLVIGNEAYYAIYDDEEATKNMLDIITQTYIGFRKHLSPLLTDQAPQGDACYVHGFAVGGQVLIKGDTSTATLSAEMCNDLESEYCRKIFASFKSGGGGSIHSCGEIRKDILDCEIATGMKAFNFGNPEKHVLADIYKKLSPHKISILGWGFNQFYDEYHKEATAGIETGVSLMAKAKSDIEAIEFLKQHRGY